MSARIAKLQFNGGELSPWLAGRMDIAKYNQTAKLCRNFLPLTEGSLKRRGGTRFVAKTPECTDISFHIVTYPQEAKVVINDCVQSSLVVAMGDVVCYEVSADGYVTTRGKCLVEQNTTLEVDLVSLSERKTLTITPTPADAVVKIADYLRGSYRGYINEKVKYMVYKNGYQAVCGEVILDSDKTLVISLVEQSEDEGNYGAWGLPLSFVCCSAYGCVYPQKKCFLIYFENGYLPILFDAFKVIPDDEDIDESLFIPDDDSGYNALFLDAQNENKLAVIRCGKNAIFYDKLNGMVQGGFMIEQPQSDSWQIDEKGNFATVYRAYDGYVAGKTIKVYYQGDLVWSMKGRSNG